MPRSPRMTHVRFHEAHRQTRNCPTGGQRRPPLQDVLRFRRKYVQFCDCVLRGRGRTPPLRHVGQFYVFTSIAANPQLPHGRTEVSAPTGRFTVSPMVRAILRLHTAGESAASTPTERFSLSPVVARVWRCTLRGRGKPLPYVTTKRGDSSKRATLLLIRRFAPPSPQGEGFGVRRFIGCISPVRMVL